MRSTFTEFFAATAASAAGLIGLPFVALNLAATRPDLSDEFVRLETRAGAALLSFINVRRRARPGHPRLHPAGQAPPLTARAISSATIVAPWDPQAIV